MTIIQRGVFLRRIMLACGAGHVRAAVEDEGHHFELRIDHDGRHVTACEAAALRYPWSVCPGALERLIDIVGTPIAQPPRIEHVDRQHHCTHLFDLARLSIAQAARGGSRRYDVLVPDADDGGTVLEVRRDDVTILHWRIVAGQVIAREAVSGAIGDPGDAREAALVADRGLLVSKIRTPEYRLSREGAAGARTSLSQTWMYGLCHTFQSPQLEAGLSMENYRDFSGRPGDLLRDIR